MGFIKNINHFANEVRYRATSGTTPPFFKKLAKIGALITGAGITFAATVSGGVIIGGLAGVFGIGLSIASILGTKDSAEVTEAKANLQAVVRKEAKELKQSLKTNDKNETNP